MRSKLALGTLAIAAALIGSGPALAQQCTTPAQLNAERAEAIRTDSILSGDSSLFTDVAPGGYLAKLATSAPSKRRQQVQAELAEANRSGSILSGDSSLFTDIAPSGDLARLATSAPTTTREQVKAELAQAIRADSILSGDSSLFTDIAPSGDIAELATAGASCPVYAGSSN